MCCNPVLLKKKLVKPLANYCYFWPNSTAILGSFTWVSWGCFFQAQTWYILQTTIPTICSSSFFNLYPIIPNIAFKSLSLTFSFHSSYSFYFDLMLSWLISPSTHFSYFLFALLSLYFLLLCCILNNLMHSVLNFPLLLNLFC